MKEILMTASEMIAALEAVKVEEYVEEVLEDMSEDDLYCNFISANRVETEQYTETEEGDLTEV